MGSDRGVSDAIGFVLVFAIIVASVGLVYAVGFQGLQDARDAERLNNAERVFDVLADNMIDLARRGAPSRATEVKLADASLTIADETSITVEVDSDSNTYPGFARPIVFSAGRDSTITYENSAVVRTDGDSAVMLRDPDFLFTDDRTVIRYVETEAPSRESVGGTTTALVRGDLATSKVLLIDESTPDITLTVDTTPARATAWNRYLEREIDWTSDPCTDPDPDGEFTCTFQSDEIFVTTAKIRVSLS